MLLSFQRKTLLLKPGKDFNHHFLVFLVKRNIPNFSRLLLLRYFATCHEMRLCHWRPHVFEKKENKNKNNCAYLMTRKKCVNALSIQIG